VKITKKRQVHLSLFRVVARGVGKRNKSAIAGGGKCTSKTPLSP
jgi:hypothetical protein